MIHYGEGSIVNLEEQRQDLSARLQRYRRLALTVGLPAVGLCLLFLLADLGLDQTYAAFGLAAVLLAGLGILIGLGIRVSKFKRRVKNVVLPLVVSRIWPDAYHHADAHLGPNEFMEAEITDEVPDRVSGSDLLEGTWAGVGVRISSIRAIQRRTRRSNNKVEHYDHTLFSGLLLVAEVSGYLRTARLRRRYEGPQLKLPAWMGGQDPSPAIATEQARPDRLDSHYTTVPSGSPIDENLFDDELEIALVKLTRHFKGRIHFQLNPRCLLLAVAGEAIDIEIDTHKPLHQQPSVEREMNQLKALLAVVEATQEVLNGVD